MKRLALILVFVSSSFAADFGGRWTGTLETPRGGRKSAVLILKQNGQQISGDFGGSETDQRGIERAKLDGDVLSFEFDFGSPVKFVLRMTGDRLAGEGATEANGTKQIFKVDLRRDSR